MANWLISLIIAAGAAGWLFNKLQQSSGYGNTRQTVTAAGLSGVFVFGVLLVLLKTFGG